MRKSRSTLVRYERDGDLVRVTLQNITNHELREVILGLWCRLDRGDRIDHLMGLRHYVQDPDAFLSSLAAAIKLAAEGKLQEIDLAAMAARGERIKP